MRYYNSVLYLSLSFFLLASCQKSKSKNSASFGYIAPEPSPVTFSQIPDAKVDQLKDAIGSEETNNVRDGLDTLKNAQTPQDVSNGLNQAMPAMQQLAQNKGTPEALQQFSQLLDKVSKTVDQMKQKGGQTQQQLQQKANQLMQMIMQFISKMLASQSK